MRGHANSARGGSSVCAYVHYCATYRAVTRPQATLHDMHFQMHVIAMATAILARWAHSKGWVAHGPEEASASPRSQQKNTSMPHKRRANPRLAGLRMHLSFCPCAHAAGNPSMCEGPMGRAGTATRGTSLVSSMTRRVALHSMTATACALASARCQCSSVPTCEVGSIYWQTMLQGT